MRATRLTALAAASMILSAVGPGPAPDALPAGDSLARAVAGARLVGPTGPAVPVDVVISLRGRDAGRLARLPPGSPPLGSAEFDSRFGPDPASVELALANLRAAGLSASWAPGAGVATATGTAAQMDRLFGVQLRNYIGADGRPFRAPDRPVRVPAALGPAVAGIAGLDNHGRYRTHASRPGGLLPQDVRRFYDLESLLSGGLDGSGETVVIPAIDDLPNLGDLDRFARLHSLPPFNVTVRRSSAWGQPENAGQAGSEVALDTEVVHAVAPGARIVVYLGSPDLGKGAVLFDQMVRENPGAIISDSIGACELDMPQTLLDQGMASNNRAVAQGMSHFVASGDSGAYDCGQNRPPAVDFMSGLPNVTSVGGTLAFFNPDASYQREAAWGDAIAQAGSGGGLSHYFKRPAYQQGPGVDNRYSNGFRQVPDVAAVADVNSGWRVMAGGREHQVGGTSAAAPLWAGVTALINQDLRRQNLNRVGFANPALYWMGQNPGRLGAAPFHEVTVGNNLLYPAGPGWNFATGLGSLDGANLDRAMVLYERSGGR